MALDSSMQGSVWFIIIVAILATIGITLIRILIGKVVEFFMIKKRENEDEIKTEISKISTILFILLAGLLLFWQRESIGSYLGKSSDEVLFVAMMVFVLVLLVAGVVYREPSRKLRGKMSRSKN